MLATSHPKTSSDSAATSPGFILPDALYRVDELRRRMGWKDAAFRAARRRGLVVRRVGKRVFVIGSDVIAFVISQGGAP